MEPIEKQTNIDEYPIHIANHSPDTVVTFGDLHGNAAKFLHLLISEGFFNIHPTDYHELITIYKQSDQETYDLQKFLILLNKIIIKYPPPKLRLIGDDLADRGKNDLLTLLIFKKLRQLKIYFEIIASNHGLEFLKQYAYGMNSPLKIAFQGIYQFFGSSLHGLRKDINQNKPLITIVEVEKMIQENYLPYLKILSYQIYNQCIFIYSHAPITANKIKLLTHLFQMKYQGNTIEELAKTIDLINENYKIIVANKEKLKLFFDELEKDQDKYKIFDDFINDRYNKLLNNIMLNPLMDYQVINIHGHVGAQKESKLWVDHWTYINLDTDLGKSEALNSDHYLIHVI